MGVTAEYEKRINSLHELDTKHTTELTNTKAEIDKLRGDVHSGRKLMYIYAECPSTENGSTPWRETQNKIYSTPKSTLKHGKTIHWFDRLVFFGVQALPNKKSIRQNE
ncbi:lysis system i-spanin subunit Rz [Providencia rettgeri]|uniref:lysis system i-spanin subunit Rz n=1 Tax=Providencia TaxID=586 RepID=UPI0039C60045